MKRQRLRSLALSMPFVAGIALGAAGTTLGASMLGSGVFSDVPAGSYFDAAVGQMYGKGIVKGYEDGRFGPNDYVTRGQVAVMFQRFAESIGQGGDGGGTTDTSSRSSRSRSSSSDTTTSSSSSSSSAANLTNCTPGTPGEAGALRFSKDAFNIGEGSKTFDVAVIRSDGKKGAVSVQYVLEPITAEPEIDYNPATGTLNFADGVTTKPFSVTIIDNKVATYNKTLRLVLKNPDGAVLGSPCGAVLTILDNDGGGGNAPSSSSTGNSSSENTSTTSSAGPGGLITFSANAYGVQENGGSIVVTVNRTGSTSNSVSVNYATSNGSAVAGTNYSSTNGTLSFGVGETSKTFSIPITDNSTIDGNRTVNLTLSNPTNGATLGPPNPVVLTIIDDETQQSSTGSFKLSQANYTVLKSAGKATIAVSRVGGAAGTVNIGYATTDGTARSGTDYTSTSGTLVFAPGEMLKTFVIPIVTSAPASDTVKNINITLSSPTAGAQLVSPSTAVLDISN